MIPLLLVSLFSLISAQGLGTIAEIHPQLTTWSCTNSHGCVPQRTAVVLDSLSRPMHALKSSKPCYNETGFFFDSVCNDTASCLENCIMEGVQDYANYGVLTHPSRSHSYPHRIPPHHMPPGFGNSVLELRQLNSSGDSVSPRVYLLHDNGRQYQIMKLIGREISFDVDVSHLPCGMNSALYLSEMDRFGGAGKNNLGGATYGTGYCDAQCPKLPFINGEANIRHKGACCNEFDIWEANSQATAFTAHPCNITGVYRCKGNACGVDGVCSQIGCSVNPYSTGAKMYYGPGMAVDTNQAITVVTQFHASTYGELESVRRLYIQNGTVIREQKKTIKVPCSGQKDESPMTLAAKTSFSVLRASSEANKTSLRTSALMGKTTSTASETLSTASSVTQVSASKTTPPFPRLANDTDTLNENFCKAIDAETYLDLGGTQAMGEALDRGMVLVFSLWWDADSGMEWLDSGKAGRCPSGSGRPEDIIKKEKNPSVKFFNIKYGEIGSTYKSWFRQT